MSYTFTFPLLVSFRTLNCELAINMDICLIKFNNFQRRRWRGNYWQNSFASFHVLPFQSFRVQQESELAHNVVDSIIIRP